MDYTIPDGPKMLRETLCVAQFAVNQLGPGFNSKIHSDTLQRLIDECDRHRPLGPDGKHGNLHTPTCGCEDVYGVVEASVAGKIIKDKPCRNRNGNVCIGEGCFGEQCLLEIADDLIATTVEPIFGRVFQVSGDYEPTLREKWFGRKRR